MKESKNIEELFSERFQNFEAPVNPEIWANVATGIGASAGGAIGGLSVVAKIIIAATTISAIGVGSFVVLNNTTKNVVATEVATNEPTDFQETIQVEPTIDSIVEQIEPESKAADKTIISEQPTDEPSFEVNNSQTQKNQSFYTDKIDFVDLDELANELKSSVHSEQPSSGEKNIEVNDSAIKNTDNTTVDDERDIVLVNLERETQEVFLEKLPNVISANNHLVFKTKNISYFKIEVFSLQGKLVYQSEDPNMVWDAMDVPAGKYVYQIELRDNAGNPLKPHVQRLEIIK